ncbi:MAG: hypothetical protein JXB40_02900 [Candidatus Omnitrophica bacterium]|nr:hypothetical protein [Candidatus Omnitrophota bacterium]
MRTRIMALAAILILSVQPAAYPQDIWAAKDGSIRNVDTRAIYVDNGRTFLATRNEVYTASGSEGKWESVFYIPAGNNEISCAGGRAGNILIGTKRGLYRSVDFGRTWRNVFRTMIPEKSSIAAISISKDNPETIIIATERGVFESADGGARWRDISGSLKNKSLRCIEVGDDYLFAGADDGLYVTPRGLHEWERVLVKANAPDPGENPEEMPDSAESEPAGGAGVRCAVSAGSRLYVATGSKILYSDDHCASWKAFSFDGLAGSVNYLLVPAKGDGLFCATTRGVFEYSARSGRWRELYAGMDKAINARSMAFTSEDEKSLWAGTDKGVYRLEIAGFPEDSYTDVETGIRTMSIISDGEPSFRELQAAAMKFNEVNPDKIRQWRQEARIKSLVPKINVGFDNSKSNSYEIYTSATKDYIVAGPDDIKEGLDVSVSWDLGQMIWSDDQTNIDVRSRLNTQLRNDILDDLRRAYFERKRLRFELITYPPRDNKLRFEKELRIQELTQAIDDITGNYLSGHTKNVRRTKFS